MTSAEPTDARIREAFLARAERAVPGDGCPDPGLVWSAVRGELPHERIREVGLHATGCAACAEAWQLAREVSRASQPEPVPFRRPSHATRRARARWIGLAVATAAALFAIALLLPGGTMVGQEGRETLRGAEETIHPLTDPGRRLARSSCTLRWNGPAASRWEIRVATEDLRVIVEAVDLDSTEFVVPAEALAGLPPGSKIVWQVHAKLPDGRRLASRSFVQSLE